MYQFLLVVTLFVGTCAFAPKLGASRKTISLNAQVESFKLHDGRSVQVFDGDYGKEICADVAATSKAAISKKGSFSLCIPGGSVVAVNPQSSCYFCSLLVSHLTIDFPFTRH